MPRTSVEAQLAKLRREREQIEKREKALLARTQGRALERIVALARENSVSVEQIVEALKGGRGRRPGRPASPRAGGKVPPKYRNPADPQQTWTGRGRSPQWVQALRAAGALDSALIRD